MVDFGWIGQRYEATEAAKAFANRDISIVLFDEAPHRTQEKLAGLLNARLLVHNDLKEFLRLIEEPRVIILGHDQVDTLDAVMRNLAESGMMKKTDVIVDVGSENVLSQHCAELPIDIDFIKNLLSKADFLREAFQHKASILVCREARLLISKDPHHRHGMEVATSQLIEAECMASTGRINKAFEIWEYLIQSLGEKEDPNMALCLCRALYGKAKALVSQRHYASASDAFERIQNQFGKSDDLNVLNLVTKAQFRWAGMRLEQNQNAAAAMVLSRILVSGVAGEHRRRATEELFRAFELSLRDGGTEEPIQIGAFVRQALGNEADTAVRSLVEECQIVVINTLVRSGRANEGIEVIRFILERNGSVEIRERITRELFEMIKDSAANRKSEEEALRIGSFVRRALGNEADTAVRILVEECQIVVINILARSGRADEGIEAIRFILERNGSVEIRERITRKLFEMIRDSAADRKSEEEALRIGSLVWQALGNEADTAVRSLVEECQIVVINTLARSGRADEGIEAIRFLLERNGSVEIRERITKKLLETIKDSAASRESEEEALQTGSFVRQALGNDANTAVRNLVEECQIVAIKILARAGKAHERKGIEAIRFLIDIDRTGGLLPAARSLKDANDLHATKRLCEWIWRAFREKPRHDIPETAFESQLYHASISKELASAEETIEILCDLLNPETPWNFQVQAVENLLRMGEFLSNGEKPELAFRTIESVLKYHELHNVVSRAENMAYNSAWRLLKKGAHCEAIKAYNNIFRLFPTGEAIALAVDDLFNLGLRCEERNEHANALQSFDTLIKRFGNQTGEAQYQGIILEARFHRAVALWRIGKQNNSLGAFVECWNGGEKMQLLVANTICNLINCAGKTDNYLWEMSAYKLLFCWFGDSKNARVTEWLGKSLLGMACMTAHCGEPQKTNEVLTIMSNGILLERPTAEIRKWSAKVVAKLATGIAHAADRLWLLDDFKKKWIGPASKIADLMRRNFPDEPECESAFDELARCCLDRLVKRQWNCDGEVIRILRLILSKKPKKPAIEIRKLAAEALLGFKKRLVDAHGAQADLTNELVTLVVEEFGQESDPDIAYRLLEALECLDQLSRRPKGNVATNLLETIKSHTEYEIRKKAANIGLTILARLHDEGKGDEGLKAAIYTLQSHRCGETRYTPCRQY